MGACTLTIEGHVVVRCEGGVPEAEHVLFDEGDVELRSLHPGSHREAAYTTTVARARERLDAAGVPSDLAAAAAQALTARQKEAYARGAGVRPIASYLGPTELFAGGVFDPTAKRYRGTWLDLEGLAIDCGVARAPVALQALSLAALLAECEPSAKITLLTEAVTRDGPAGVRTHRRVPLDHAVALPDALAALDRRSARALPAPVSGGPSREELLADVQARMGLAPDAATQERLLAVERALSVRPRPTSGPLADDALWALEIQLTVGDPRGVADRCEAIEREHGRNPATLYLRARAALLGRAEQPRVLAERVSALASSLDSFRELELLAAQAWAAAGELPRALAYARDLAEDPHAPSELRTRARDLAGDAAAGRTPRISVAPQSIPVDRRASSKAPRPARRADADPRSEPPDPTAHSQVPDTLVDGGVHAIVGDSEPPPVIPRDPPVATLASVAYDVEAVAEARSAAPVVVAAEPPPVSAPASSLRGGSQPPLATIAPPPRAAIPEQPLAPPALEGHSELVEKLTLPPGLHGQAPTSERVPRTVLDARVLFTYLARDLAREMRERRGVALRTDAAGIEAVQRELRVTYPPGTAITDETAFGLRRHGALFSEVLARSLGGYWMDIAPSELGYWVMVVPSRARTVRVLPFGRVYRDVALGAQPGEKDLVTLFRELSALVYGHA